MSDGTFGGWKRHTCVYKLSCAAVAAAILVIAGCGSDEVRTENIVDGRTVFVVNKPSADCDDTGACASAPWVIDGRGYQLQCRDNLPVEGAVLYAVAGDDFKPGWEAWTVEGHDPSSLLYVPQAGGCTVPSGPGRTYLTAWCVVPQLAGC